MTVEGCGLREAIRQALETRVDWKPAGPATSESALRFIQSEIERDGILWGFYQAGKPCSIPHVDPNG